MQRLMLISSDCHAGVAWELYRPYVEARYMDDFEEWLKERLAQEVQSQQWRNAFFSQEHQDRWNKRAEELTGRPTNLGWDTGVWSAEERITALEGDGVVAEVMFPDGRRNSAPFRHTQGSNGGSKLRELQDVGRRIYNRWLAEFCASRPAQSLGVAAIDIFDIEQAVDDIHLAKRSGLVGINLPCTIGALAPYNHPRYEPIWAACDELDFPIHFHIGGAGLVGQSPFQAAGAPEARWYQRRPLWQLIAGGVLERHPALRMTLVEQGMEWVPDALRDMDALCEEPGQRELRTKLSLKPSEYFARNCWVGHSNFQARWQWELRHEVGVDRLMWGSDFPHPEGLWPHTQEWLRDTLGGMPEQELRMVLGENAAKFYKLDVSKLAPIVERVGPAFSAI